jgi:DNA repair exonuclease SbcCD nuclease subunit
MKIIVMGDTHYGEKSNDPKFNGSLVDLFEWTVDIAKERNIDTMVHLGDYYHNRNAINVQTINYGIDGAKILAEHFDRENVYVLLGNHDIYFKDRLDTNSLSIIEPYVTIVDSLTAIDNVLLTPWIVDGEQWDKLVKESKKYDFLMGHFEFNGFKMNDYYVMEHGNSHKELKNCKKVLSGHFHSPQVMDNVHYVGTPIPTTMSEANEPHGINILDTETGELEFIEYTKVKVISIPYTEIESLDDYDPEYTSVRIEFPDDLDDETLIGEVQEYLADKKFDEVKIKYKGNKAKQLLESSVETIEEVENIDLVVKTFLKDCSNIDGIDKEVLLKYYDAAVKKSEEN